MCSGNSKLAHKTFSISVWAAIPPKERNQIKIRSYLPRFVTEPRGEEHTMQEKFVAPFSILYSSAIRTRLEIYTCKALV